MLSVFLIPASRVALPASERRSLCGGDLPVSPKSRQRFRRLQQASNHHRSHLAAALGERYCQLHPTHAPAWLFYGRALAETARYDEARDALRRGLDCAPPEHHATFYAQLGHLEALAGTFTAAESWYRKAFDTASTDSEERLHLGDICYRQGKLHEAEMVLRQVTTVWNESMGEACHLLGEVLASQRRYVEALHAFQRAAEAAPSCRKHARRVRELTKIVRRDGPPAT
jgi:tetratricopeptide (TPR) repeat protein